MNKVVCAHFFFKSEKGEADFASDCKVSDNDLDNVLLAHEQIQAPSDQGLEKVLLTCYNTVYSKRRIGCR